MQAELKNCMRFEGFMAVAVDIIILRDMMPVFCLLFINPSVTTPKIGVMGSSRMLVNIYQTAGPHITRTE